MIPFQTADIEVVDASGLGKTGLAIDLSILVRNQSFRRSNTMSTDTEKLNDLMSRSIRIESKMTAIANQLGIDPSQGRALHFVNDDVYIESMAVSLHDIEKHVKSSERWRELNTAQHEFDIFLGAPGNCTMVGCIIMAKGKH